MHDNVFETSSCLQAPKASPLHPAQTEGFACALQRCYSYVSHSNAGRLIHFLQAILGTITALESLLLKWNNVIPSTVLPLLTFTKSSQSQTLVTVMNSIQPLHQQSLLNFIPQKFFLGPSRFAFWSLSHSLCDYLATEMSGHLQDSYRMPLLCHVAIHLWAWTALYS